jgi:hypothetical protein
MTGKKNHKQHGFYGINPNAIEYIIVIDCSDNFY